MSYGNRSLDELAEECHETSVRKGFWGAAAKERLESGVRPFVESVSAERAAAALALIHSEASEALEALRDGKLEMWTESGRFDQGDKPEGFTVELADIIIRCLELSEAMGLAGDLERAVRQKMHYNEGRPAGHGRKVL